MRSRTVYRLSTVLLTLLLLLAAAAWIQPPVKATETTAVKRYVLGFDGEDDYVEVAHSDVFNVSEFTIEAWINPYRDFAKTWQIVSKRHDWSTNIPFEFRGWYVSHVELRVANPTLGNEYINVQIPNFQTHKWFYVYAYYDGSKIGVGTIGAKREKDWAGPLPTNTRPIYIGKYYGGENAYGLIALVRIYSRALTDSEIQHNYLNPMSPITDGLILWLQPVVDWTKSPPEVLDFSGNGNNGKLYGATLVEADSDSVPPIVIPAGFVLQTYNVSWSEKKVFNWVNITSTGIWADGNKTYTENVIQLTYTKYYEKTATNRYEHVFTVAKKTLPETSVVKFSNPITSDYLKVYVDNSEVLELSEYDFEKSRTPCWHREAGEIWVKVTDNSTVQVVWENKTEQAGGGGGGGVIVPPITTTTTTTTSTSTEGVQYQPPSQTPASPIPPIHEVLKPLIDLLTRLFPFSGIQVPEAPRLPLNLDPILVVLLFASCLGLAYMLTMSGGSRRGRKTRRRSRRTSTRRRKR